MLVLSRKSGEKVVIDGGIAITVVEFRGGRVKIGIEAPADVAILRGELATAREGSCLAACVGTEQVGAESWTVTSMTHWPLMVAARKAVATRAKMFIALAAAF